MKPPISVIGNNRDVTIYASVMEAETAMEAIDVERDEYVVMDADGQHLVLKVVMEEVPLFWGLCRSRIRNVRIMDPSTGD